MRHHHRSLASLLIVSVGAAALVTLPARGDGDDGYVAEQAMVELVDGADIEQLSAEFGTTVLAGIPAHGLFLLGLPDGWTEEQFELIVEEDERVEEAELNHESDAPEGQTQSFFVQVLESTFQGQYVWPRITLDPAHALTRGGGVVVAVLDTGVDATHPVLAERIATGGYDFVNGTTDVSDAGNGLDDDGDGDVDELVGHGTFLAGLVAAVAPEATILPIKVLDGDGTSNAFHVAQGIFHAVDQGADVINLSLGTTESNEMLELALEYAAQQGVVVVAATGNLGVDEPLYPADDQHTIAVVATDADDVRAPFSNYGEHVALSAPGVEVSSTVPGAEYGQWSGTSMATAIVSGAAALLRAVDPEATPALIEQVLRESADPIDALNPGFEGMLGAGRLNAAAAVELLAPAAGTGDLNADGAVDVEDLLIVIGAWGPCPADPGCTGDANADAVVDIEDLLLVIMNWS
jgi:subtilisin family serine protease